MIPLEPCPCINCEYARDPEAYQPEESGEWVRWACLGFLVLAAMFFGFAVGFVVGSHV